MDTKTSTNATPCFKARILWIKWVQLLKFEEEVLGSGTWKKMLFIIINFYHLRSTFSRVLPASPDQLYSPPRVGLEEEEA